MGSISILTWMMIVPLVGAVLTWLAKGKAREVALGASLVTLGLAIIAWARFDSQGAQFQLTENRQWIPQFGVSYSVGVDGTALALIVMAAILVPVCILAAWRDLDDDNPRLATYFALMLVLETFMVGVFAALDVFLFYVFFEAMLIPVYFLIGMFGGPGRRKAATKFILFSLAGGLIMLVAVIALYSAGPGGANGLVVQVLAGNIEASTWAQRLMFLGFFIAFAIKAPMWPVHTWLPEAASEARPATAVLLVGVLDKVGTFGMIRFCLQLFPEASKWATPTIITLAVISVIYGAILAIGQTDMMRLIAFTSISHFGFIVMGIFALTSTAGAGSSLYMVNHGFTTAGLFLIAGFLIARGGSRRIADYGGWQRVTPVLAGTFLVSGLSGLSLPGLSSFVSEFLVMVGTFQRYTVAAVVATLGVVLAALYILLMYQRLFTGPAPEFADDDAVDRDITGDGDDAVGRGGATAYRSAEGEGGRVRLRGKPRDLHLVEKVAVVPIIAALVVLGFYPKPVLDVINPSVEHVLTHVGAQDPAPTLATGGNQ